MWGERVEGSAGEFVCMDRKNASARQINAICTSVLRFLIFIVDGKFAISAGHSRHELAPGPRDLRPLSVILRVSLSSEHHPSFPILPFLYWLSFLLEALSLTPTHTIPVPLGLLPLVPSSGTTL